MAVTPRYEPERKKYVIVALDLMLKKLQEEQKLTDQTSLSLDTFEQHKQVLGDTLDPEDEPSDEEIQESVHESTNQALRSLEHTGKRILEVQGLKVAFENDQIPSALILNRTFQWLRSAALLEGMRLSIMSGLDEIVSGKVKLTEEKTAYIHKSCLSLKIYSEALMMGFHLSPMFWSEPPFDEV